MTESLNPTVAAVLDEIARMRAPRPATQRQQQVLDFIIASIEERGFPPTLREVMARFGWTSTNAASDHLRALERKGLVILDDMKSRGIRIPGVRWKMVPNA